MWEQEVLWWCIRITWIWFRIKQFSMNWWIKVKNCSHLNIEEPNKKERLNLMEYRITWQWARLILPKNQMLHRITLCKVQSWQQALDSIQLMWNTAKTIAFLVRSHSMTIIYKKMQRFAKLLISKYKSKTSKKKFWIWMNRRMTKMLQGKEEEERIENISWESNPWKVLQAATNQ